MENNNDFYFGTTAPLPLGSTGKKFRQNEAAIKILKACQTESRPASAEEQVALSLYSGWGDSAVLRTLLYDWEGRELRELLTWEEQRAIRGSSLNAHYTSLPVISAIWQGLMHLGADQLPELRIIDPSAGIGHFKSCTPETLRQKASWVEVELDQLTASILSLLHPGSTVYQDGYEKVSLPSSWFDLAISNIPFGDYGVAFKGMPAFLRRSIHNFFFARTVSLLRPGGVIAFITSRYTMDAHNSIFRTWLAKRTDLLAAVRLPDNAFKANAGTEVVTDIIFLRKRALERTDTDGLDWIESKPISLTEGVTENINEYFIKNPQMVMGEHSSEGSMYHRNNYTVKAHEDIDLGEAITEALCSALPAGCLSEPMPITTTTVKRKVVFSLTDRAETDPHSAALLGVFNFAKALLTADAESAWNADELREDLNRRYNEFTKQYGPISANLKAIDGTPEAAFLRALELDFDPVSMTARKAGLFFSPVIRSAAKIALNPTPTDALVISLEQKAKVDMDYICAGTGMNEDQVRLALDGVIFQTPTGEWQTADEYLSGNVRAKLREAENAAALDPRFQKNVEALRSVLPTPRTAEKIHAQLGSGWIPAGVIEDFIRHLLGAYYVVRHVPEMAHWEIHQKYKWDNVPAGVMYQKWGTTRCSAIDLIDDALNARIPAVYDEDADGNRAINHAETVAAQAKLLEIREEFEKWLWADEERKTELENIYNETFRSFVPRRYDGSHLVFPGLRSSIQLRPAQRDVVWRVLLNKSAAIIHEVGMGKTLSIIASIMEAHRLGISRKAMVVVPNHLVSAWSDAVLWAYPNANVLYPNPKDISKENRGAWMSKIATNDWDFVIVPFSSFKLLPVSPKTESEFYQREIDQLEEYLVDLKGDKDSVRVIKQIEKAIKRFRVKLDTLSEMQKDNRQTISFEEMGIDFLAVDEFHAYKNLFFATKMSRIAGLPNSDSQRAFDMYMKVRWLQTHGGKFIGATGTPVTNTLAEMFTMQRYFQLETLEELGLAHFDAWASSFAVAEPGLEMTPDGGSYRMNTRFRRFVNVPDLSRIWAQVADTRRIKPGSGVERPDLFGDKPIKVSTPASQALKDYTRELSYRADKIRAGIVQPHQDNMLKVTSDGRKAALDMSLVTPAPDGAPMPKIDALVEIAAEIFFASNKTRGTQLIFCDLATPKAHK